MRSAGPNLDQDTARRQVERPVAGVKRVGPLWSSGAEDVGEPADAFDAAVAPYDRFLSKHEVERTFHDFLLM